MAKAALNDDEALWTLTDLAAFLRTSRGMAQRRYRAQGIPFLLLGRRVMFLPSEVRRWARARQEKGH